MCHTVRATAHRELPQRVRLACNAAIALLALIGAVIATVASLSLGCKNSGADPHDDDKDWLAELPTFCRSRRALAVFMWMTTRAFCLGFRP